MQSWRTRLAALVVGVAVVVAAVLLWPGGTDDPDEAQRPPTSAPEAVEPGLTADWLTAQLTDGLVHNDQYDIDDHGLSIDVALALHAQGGHDATVAQVSDALAGEVDAYTRGGTKDLYSGSVAKLASFVTRTGADPASFGGVDLLARLEGLVSTRPVSAGRFEDRSAAGDFANTIGQAFGAHALTEADSPLAAPVTAYLLEQQCEGGGFRLLLTEDKTARDQSCDADSATPEIDATALVVLALLEIEDPPDEVLDAVQDARSWLLEQQQDDGSLPGSANATGLAGWVFGRLGSCDPARRAARWLSDLQVPAGEPEAGAVAYAPPALDALPASGRITTRERDQWRRATAQAAPALEHLRPTRCQAGDTALPGCDPDTEIAVVVEYRALGGPERPDLSTCVVSDAAVASELLIEAGVELTTARTVPGFVCRVDGVPADDPCVTAAPADAYWGVWWADDATGWTYSTLGVDQLEVPVGGSVAMVWDDEEGDVAPAVGAGAP